MFIVPTRTAKQRESTGGTSEGLGPPTSSFFIHDSEKVIHILPLRFIIVVEFVQKKTLW